MTLGPSNPDLRLLQAVETPAGGAHTLPPAQDWRRHQSKEPPRSQRGKENGDLASFTGSEDSSLTFSLLLWACVTSTVVRDEL